MRFARPSGKSILRIWWAAFLYSFLQESERHVSARVGKASSGCNSRADSSAQTTSQLQRWYCQDCLKLHRTKKPASWSLPWSETDRQRTVAARCCRSSRGPPEQCSLSWLKYQSKLVFSTEERAFGKRYKLLCYCLWYLCYTIMRRTSSSAQWIACSTSHLTSESGKETNLIPVIINIWICEMTLIEFP